MCRAISVAWAFALLSLAAPLSVADEDVDQLIAYLLHELGARQTSCGEEQRAAHLGLRVVCGTYADTFSAFKSDWDPVLRHSKLPIRLGNDQPWTYRDGSYANRFSFGTDRELFVSFRPSESGLLFAYAEQDIEPDAEGPPRRGPLDLTENEDVPRMAGFGGVSLPRLVEESRVEPYRSLRAQIDRVVGSAIVEIVVNRDGSVRSVQALSATPKGYGFGESAVAAVRQWHFEPALFEGRPVDAVLNQTVEVHQDLPPPADE
jgi:TonB family protein